MLVIHKHILKITDEQILELKGNARILSVANQDGKLALWEVHNDKNPAIARWKIIIIGTGNEFDGMPGYFIGTAICGSFVWHVFAIEVVA